MTKNMEDLLWRGDSLDREYPTIHSLCIQAGVKSPSRPLPGLISADVEINGLRWSDG